MMRFMTCLHLGNLEVFVWLFGLGAKACEKHWGLLQIQINADGVKYTSYFDVRSFSIHQGFMNL